jgi:hypothetical protein
MRMMRAKEVLSRPRKSGLALAAFAVVAASLASDVASADETPTTPAPTKLEGIQFVDSWTASFSCYGKAAWRSGKES